jgi:hypothetical protein
MDYTCECLGVSYTGPHCEIKARKTAIRQAVSRSFAFVVLTALGMVAAFIVAMDVLKYGFGIDPVHKRDDRRRRRREMYRQKKRTFSVAIRFLYINGPTEENSRV